MSPAMLLHQEQIHRKSEGLGCFAYRHARTYCELDQIRIVKESSAKMWSTYVIGNVPVTCASNADGRLNVSKETQLMLNKRRKLRKLGVKKTDTILSAKKKDDAGSGAGLGTCYLESEGDGLLVDEGRHVGITLDRADVAGLNDKLAGVVLGQQSSQVERTRELERACAAIGAGRDAHASGVARVQAAARLCDEVESHRRAVGHNLQGRREKHCHPRPRSRPMERVRATRYFTTRAMQRAKRLSHLGEERALAESVATVFLDEEITVSGIGGRIPLKAVDILEACLLAVDDEVAVLVDACVVNHGLLVTAVGAHALAAEHDLRGDVLLALQQGVGCRDLVGEGARRVGRGDELADAREVVHANEAGGGALDDARATVRVR
eukprot:572214-Pleurochrysis_carterae.AAC.3